jgi:predicted metal-dependent hydrolase
VSQAQRLLDAGMPFHAHEVFEDAWKAASDPADRTLWRGMAQLAVGLTHALRGNPAGATALLRRGAETITARRDDTPHGIDVAAVLRWAAEVAQDPTIDAGPPILAP